MAITAPRRPLSALVVAHPDDEALWLSSAVSTVDQVVLSFGAVFRKPGRSMARSQAVAALPLDAVVHLDIPESGVNWKAYLARPELTSSGVEILEPDVRQRYDANFARLLEGLRASLAGCRDVYTHNPWGEYGHAEHIQVYRAVTALQHELDYTVWFSNYVGRKNWRFVTELAGQLSWDRRSVVQPDRTTARTLMQTYRQYGAWTWTSGHRWPEHEVIYAQLPRRSAGARHAFTDEWLLDVKALRRWSAPWQGPWRLLDPAHERRAHALPL